MKLISLNIQGGAQGKPFFKYIKDQAKRTDIFCFQEVYNSKKSAKVNCGEITNVYSRLTSLLKGFKSAFLPVSSRVGEYFKIGFPVESGMAIFYKKSLRAETHFGKHIIGSLHGKVDFRNGKEANAIQCVKIVSPKGKFWLANFHGISRPGDKLDTPKRIKQSETIISVLKKLKGPKILCGDFNLMAETKSVRIIERAGFKNLIKIYKIKNTRNSISWKRYKNRQCFADFTFVFPEIKVKNFKVPYNLASDHLPMVLEFELL